MKIKINLTVSNYHFITTIHIALVSVDSNSYISVAIQNVTHVNPLAPELFFLVLAHTVYEM